ncbi:hypothetical protein PRIPAC_90771 [Pristionchus pacificus]|uniref:Uncharacterized protein n=1 Tax=Pristionchus pacificus TaxID=54126 RepID=A0A2A6CWY8_PRIPA|nr:hypothetical protein PRIPAC_90771 [Pristionchus pacificus]|eukprot:PDM82695.1 hypothetical protein PRIPAC_37088 [Pristionchus pacificus]
MLSRHEVNERFAIADTQAIWRCRATIHINMDSIEQRRQNWTERRGRVIARLRENRGRIIARLREIADIMEGWYLGGRIANIGGSSLGIIGGSLIVGGLFSPPLLVPGIVTSLVGAGGNIGASLGRLGTVKRLAAEAEQLLEEDARLINAFVNEADINIQLNAGLGSAAAAFAATLRALVATLSKRFITVPLGASGKHSLKAIVPAAATAPIRVLAGLTAGIGMAFDVVSLIKAATSLARNESDEIAAKLREVADSLQKIPINMESIEQRRNEWAENRRRVIAKLRHIAGMMESRYLGGRIVVLGGHIYLGGFLFQPLLNAGIVTTLLGVGCNLVAPQIRVGIVKHVLGPELIRLLEADDRLLSALVNEAEIYIQLNFGAAAAALSASLRALVAVLRKSFITVPPGAVRRHSLKTFALAPVPEYAGARIGVAIHIVPRSTAGEIAR